MATPQHAPQFIPRQPSIRADLARVLTSLTVRPLEHLIPEGPLGVTITRGILGSLMFASGRSGRGVDVTPVREEYAGAPVAGEWARPASYPAPASDRGPGAAEDAAVVFYVHGSGYALCSTRTHRPLVTSISGAIDLPVFSVEYRLAPEHVFPAAADDVEAGYRWLLEQGWAPGQVVVMGDSAGGHLILDLVLDLARRGEELPAAMVMFSPLVDVTFELSRRREQIRRDPMLSAEGARRLVAHYVADTDPLDPRLTHAIAEGEVLCPTLVQAGGAEMLAADAHHVARMLAATGTPVQLEVWPGQMHVFQAAARIIPEARPAIVRATRFAREALAARRAAAHAAHAAPAQEVLA